MHNLLRDFKFAIRSFARTPGVTAVAIITVALGVGANAAIFSIVHRVLIAPLPYPGADRVVIPWRHNATMGGLSVSPSYNDLGKWRKAAAVEALTMYSGKSKVMAGSDEPRTVAVTEVAPDLLDFVGVQPRLGRPFTADDAASQDAARVVLLTDAFWRSEYAADPAVIGRGIDLSDQRHQIGGVLPSSFRLPLVDRR